MAKGGPKIPASILAQGRARAKPRYTAPLSPKATINHDWSPRLPKKWTATKNGKVVGRSGGRSVAPRRSVARKPAPVSNRSGCASGNCGGSRGSSSSRARSSTKPKARYNKDWNSNLREAVFKGNRDNQSAIAGFDKIGRGLTDTFLSGSKSLSDKTTGRYNTAYNGYNDIIRGYLGDMGTADQDIHTRNRGQAYAGLDSGFGDANDAMQAQLARRGLSNSGIGAKAGYDLGQSRMRAGSEAGVNAYNSAVDMSDRRRGQRMAGEGNLYSANLDNINRDYTMGMGQLNQDYSSRMGLEGQLMQNRINNNQQRQANLMGYSQLGRGMSGMSANYLNQAGTGFGNLGQIAGNTASAVGQLNNSFNQTMQGAMSNYNNANTNLYGSQMKAYGDSQNRKSDAKGANTGMLGSLGSTMLGGIL